MGCGFYVAERNGCRIFDIEMRQLGGARLNAAKNGDRGRRRGEAIEQRSAVHDYPSCYAEFFGNLPCPAYLYCLK
jgi:hypothetical protein